MITNTIKSSSEAELPYYEIPDYPEDFTAGTMAARMIDALGFRFYWSSEGLKETDLAYKAYDNGKTTLETISHIFDLSKVIINATLKQSNIKVEDNLNYLELRAKTLQNLKTAADILRASDDISQFKIIFEDREFPLWNLVNGAIADSIWHCGQLSIYRRSSGNYMNPKVNFFTGKLRE
ncbi:hypothetical protein [Winogradskyella vidalii]|uniref:hypothetical protein n=1 Tax=Winogradskyella vidalii TaxID=2615024 RepID=UPI0015CB6240|nr:hypothetical protein [Winogradskyella vidalii]